MQTLGASGGCHVGAAILKEHYGPWKNSEAPEIFLPGDSWCELSFGLTHENH